MLKSSHIRVHYDRADVAMPWIGAAHREVNFIINYFLSHVLQAIYMPGVGQIVIIRLEKSSNKHTIMNYMLTQYTHNTLKNG